MNGTSTSSMLMLSTATWTELEGGFGSVLSSDSYMMNVLNVKNSVPRMRWSYCVPRQETTSTVS